MTVADLQNQASGIQSEISNWQSILSNPGASVSYRTHAQMQIDQLKDTLMNLQMQIAQATNDAALAAQAQAAIDAQLAAAAAYAAQQAALAASNPPPSGNVPVTPTIQPTSPTPTPTPVPTVPGAVYTGQSSAQGGTWGNTAATLAAQQVAGGQIQYTVQDASGALHIASEAEAAKLTQQAVASLSDKQKEQYKATVAALESSAGETAQEKLASYQQQAALEYAQKRSGQDNEALLAKVQAEAINKAQKEYGIEATKFAEGSATTSKEAIAAAAAQPLEVLKTGAQPVMIQVEPGQDIDKKAADQLKKDYVKVGEGEYLSNEKWAHLAKEDQQAIMDKGLAAYQEALPKITLKSGEHVLKADYDALPAPMQKALTEGGFEAINLDKLTPEARFKKMQEWEMIPADAEFGGIDEDGNITFKPSEKQVKSEMPWYDEAWQSLTPWDESKGETATAEGSAIMAAEALVPFVYSVRNWDKMNDQERALSLGMDLLSSALIFIPAVRGVSTAVRMGMSVPKALLRGTGRVAAELTYRQVSDPVRMLMHPLETVKAPFRVFKEIAGGKTVPYEAHFRGIAGGDLGGSDLKLKVGGGNEMAGATLEGVSELVKAGQAGTKAETLVGTQLVKLSNTGFEKIANRPVQTTSLPGLEKMLQEIDETGHITARGAEEGIYSSVGGTEFWRQAAAGGMGQIPGGVHCEGAIELLDKKITKLRDPDKMIEEIYRLEKKGESVGTATTGGKIYHNSAEFESITRNGAKQFPVLTDKYKTFKWKEPEPVLAQKSGDLMKMAAQAEKMAKEAKTVDEAAVHLKNADKLAKDSVEAFKDAVKKGAPKEVRTNIDYLESIDPITGQNLIFLHTVLEGSEAAAKPWTKAQIAGWKVKGFMNIPRDIFVPALSRPKISPERLITEVGKRLNESEKLRLADGLDLMDILSKQKINPKSFAKVSMADVEMIPKESAALIDKWFAKNDHRLYGSMVEWTQARTPFTAKPNDLDFALNNPEKGINELADIIRRTSKLEIAVEPARLGGAGAVIRRVSDGQIIIEGHSMIEHLHDLPFGMPVSKPTVQAGIFKQEQLSEQLMRRGNALLMPGFGPQGRSAFGPEAAAMYKRMKDYGKFGDASTKLIASMREEAEGLSGIAKSKKLAEADKAEELLRRFIKKPSAADLKAAGLDPKATLDQYYEMMGKKFNATAEKVESALPQVNPDKYLPEYEARVHAAIPTAEAAVPSSVAKPELWKSLKQEFTGKQAANKIDELKSFVKKGDTAAYKKVQESNSLFHRTNNKEIVSAALDEANKILEKYNMPKLLPDELDLVDRALLKGRNAGGWYETTTGKIVMDIEDFVPGKSTSSVQTLLHESWHKIHYGEFEKLITAEKREGMNKLIKDLAEKHPDTNQFELWERIKQAMTELGAERATDRLMQTPRMADADFKKWRKFWQEFYFGDFIKKYGKDEYLKFEKFAQRAADEYINAKGIKHIPDGKIPPKMQKAVDNAVERYVGEYRKQQLAQKALSYTSKNVPLRLGATVAKGRVSADGRAAERPTAERAPQSVRTTGRISAERITAERIAPDRISPDRVSAERVSPDRITPDRVSPERVTPERVTPERVSPERVSPERISPERVTPERIAPDRITPDRITPERVTPERITPDRITPDRITPDRITPDRITPDTPRIRITPPRRVPPDITRIITHIQEHSEHKKLDPKQFEGMLAWKQGFVYQIRWKPFGKTDVFYSREPIPEVKYFDGIGSAAKSAVALYGEIPKQVRVDMGIIDVNIFRGKDMDKPVLNFKADPKQKTHYTGIEKQSGSIKKSK